MTDDARLRTESAQIEHLLEELRELVVPAAWQRIEQVLRRVVALYGAGLERILDHAGAAGAAPPRLAELLGDDDLLASLLVLHGLHPLSTEQRIRRALDLARTELAIDERGLELVAIDDGVVQLRAAAALGGGAMSARVAEGVVRRALESAAPEITAVTIATPAATREPELVQIRIRREARDP